MSVCLDGSTLSALLFSHLNGANQYGFLLGEKIEHIEDKISDSQIHTYDVNSYLYVSSFTPWPSQHCIYSRDGVINDELMQSILSNKKQAIVGWYSFRHNTSLRPSLKETTLHNNLAVSSSFTGQSQDFIFLLCTSSPSPDMSIHTCHYGFMHLADGSFLNLPLTVMNLGDTTRKEYRKKSNATLSYSQTISGVLHSSQKDFVKSSGEMDHIVKVNHLESSLNNSLVHVQSKIIESEQTLGSLEREVTEMRQQLFFLEQEEIEAMFRKQEEKRQCELEEQRKLNAKEDADEQKELEQLLKDLGVSSDDVPCGIQPMSFTVEYPLRDHSAGNALSVSKERAFEMNIDRNANNMEESGSKVTLDHGPEINYEQELSTNSAEVCTHKLRNTRTLKNNTDDTFAFVKDELKLQGATSKKQQIIQPCASKNTGTTGARGQGSSKGRALDPHEYPQCEDVQRTGVKPIHKTHNNGLHQGTSDIVFETPVNNVLGDEVDLERPQHDSDVCDDRAVISASPVF
ncbi:hypothetical protein BsWGS_01436 [Bradybaena similaris]